MQILMNVIASALRLLVTKPSAPASRYVFTSRAKAMCEALGRSRQTSKDWSYS